MRIESTVTVQDAPVGLFDALEAEAGTWPRNKRSSTTMGRDGRDVVITIMASDAAAYRAAANSAAKLLVTFEQMQSIDNG